ncbi:MAG: SMC-Scp complex subunit ScpB [Candidatus Nanopelagicales bacterium]|nr:SMC-Scp complex subunit ScpB [Candidatus Nanopelagicales bacterium]MDZ4249984.1 SMC-Scp complex subunit ScpB [Candidatus Nanopelagicales bacterium]
MGDVVDLRSGSAEALFAAEPEAGLGAPSRGAALEALLLLADEPVSSLTLAELTGCPEPDIVSELLRLSAEYRRDGRGFDLREVGGAWRFYTSDTCSELVARYATDGRQARLTQAALETLAIIAYRQPVSRARIGAIRGVSCDGVVRTLVARGLVTEVGEDTVAGAVLFGTTTYFLDRMGISSLEELPPIAEHLPSFDSLDELLESQ